MGGSCICGYLASYIAIILVCMHVPTSKSLILPHVLDIQIHYCFYP